MEGAKSNIFLILLFTFVVIIPIGRAHIAHWDEVWQKRAEEAREHYLKAYHPEPENVTSALVKAVHETLKSSGLVSEGNNSTRRQLRKSYKGPCQATNPIDRCWRCDPNWANNRKRLADCALGFGHNTKGGKDGEFYVVTDRSDDVQNPRPGTLRHAVIQKRPLWITFKHDMIIRLNAELIMQGDKTIDGRGARVYITGGAGITIQYVKNVIIHGLHITNIVEGSGGMIRDSEDHIGTRTKSDGDGITVFGSSDVWLDHLSMRKCYDGLIDVLQASTAVTISNSHFTDHNEVMLFGAQNSYTGDEKMQVTLAFNHFGKRLIQRMPRCRFGYVHVVNNDYTHWEMYAIGGSMHTTIISQGNRYIAPNDQKAKEITHRNDAAESEWKHWVWRSEGDLFMNGAFFVQSGDDPNWTKTHQEYFDGLPPAPGTQVGIMTKFAGVVKCKVGKPC